MEEPAGGLEPPAGVASLSGRCEHLRRRGVALSHRLAARGRIGPFALFRLIGWPRRRTLPGEARESPRNAPTSGSVRLRARAHARACTLTPTRARPCTRAHHPARAHYTQLTRLRQTRASGAHPLRGDPLRPTGGIPHATRRPEPPRGPDGWKARLAGRQQEGVALFRLAWQRLTAG